MFTDPLPCNRRPIVARVVSRGDVFIESLPSNMSQYHDSVYVVIRLWTGRPRILFSIPGKGEKFASFPQNEERLYGLFMPLSSEY
jgi:hypothetical protein